jgi:polar amino acid transport system substrate-binding protein
LSARSAGAAVTFVLAAITAMGVVPALTTNAQAQSSALYTDAQAQMGVDPYENKCGMCHGANMEGQSGPTLLGPTFTTHYPTVGDLMQFIVKNMPKDDPGTLSHDDYVDILAFILLKNGWPSGAHALTFDDASASKAALVQTQ